MNNSNRILPIALVLIFALIMVLSIMHWKRTHPHSETGTFVMETDSTIVTTIVQESKDSAGNIQYETIREVKKK